MRDLERRPSKTSKRRIDLGEDKVPMAPAVFAQMGMRAHSLRKFVMAMRQLDQAVELDPEGTVALETRASALIALAFYPEALEEAQKLEERMARSGRRLPLTALYQQARALWHAGEFERAAVLAARGMRKRRQPPYFTHMFLTSLGTLEQSIGPSAGECLVELRDDIHALAKQQRRSAERRKERWRIAEETKTKEELRRERRYQQFMEERRVFLTHVYMGQLGHDWRFASELGSSAAITKSHINRESAEGIRKFIRILGDSTQNRLDTLNEQCPHYVRHRRMESRSSPQLRGRRMTMVESQARQLDEEAFNCIIRVLEARERGDRKAVNSTIAAARKYLEKVSIKQLPDRQNYMLVLCQLLGVVFLETNLLRQRDGVESDEQDRERKQHVHAILGLSKDVDLLVKDAQMPFVDYREVLRLDEARAEVAKSKLERMVATYEMALCYSKLGRWENSLNCARRAIATAKDLSSLVWGINSAVALAKAEFHLNMRLEARASIKEAIDMALVLGDEDVLEMLDLVAEEIERPTAAEGAADGKGPGGGATPQERLLQLMATPELRMQCRNLLAHMDTLPPDSRLPLHPRWRDRERHPDEARQRQRQSMALFHK